MMDASLKSKSSSLQGLTDALPIVLAYFPIAITFGVVSSGIGLPGWITALISIWVYAGAAQFMLISLAAAGADPVSATLTLLLVNMRHFLYGTTLGPAYTTWPEPSRWLSAFGLTDEVFAITSSRALVDPPEPTYQFSLTFACYGSWVAGTIVGVLIGAIVPHAVENVLTFALPALFIALWLGQYRTFAQLVSAVAGGILTVLLEMWKVGSLSIVLGALVGATVGFILSRLQTAPPANACQRE